MANNLVIFDPADNEWCVVCRIGSIGETHKTTVSFHKTRDKANEAAARLREKINIPVNIQIFQYSYAKDELDILNLFMLDSFDFVAKYMEG